MKIYFFILLFTSVLELAASPKREMRALWIASVLNIDWPSSPHISTSQQKTELINILELAKKNNLTTVFLQVRPTSDAFFKKSIEPWSYWLTGKQGMSPTPLYDPLEFAIKECRKRGLELHAWVNPFRVIHEVRNIKLTARHPIKQHPEWTMKYGKLVLLNPGIKEARDYVVKVLAHLVANYDVDGLHIDDYFYPYPKRGFTIPDNETFRKNKRRFTNIGDWRRDNVNIFIKQLHDTLKIIKPKVKFGISPFAIWHNKKDHSKGSNTNGLSGYLDLYADIYTWMKNGWVDYVVPQLYGHSSSKNISYVHLLDWWSKNKFHHHLYIGIGLYNFVQNKKRYGLNELDKQIYLLRENKKTDGLAIYNTSSLKKMNVHSGFIRKNYFKDKVLPPIMPWKDSIPPMPIRKLSKSVGRYNITYYWEKGRKAADGDSAHFLGVYKKNTATNEVTLIEILSGNTVNFLYKKTDEYTIIGIQAIDRLFNVSDIVFEKP